MDKRKDFTGIEPSIHRLAKTQASAQGMSIRDYLAKLINQDTEKGRKNA